jgi:hypothetical protein
MNGLLYLWQPGITYGVGQCGQCNETDKYNDFRPTAALCPSTVEDQPADLVPQPLILKDELANHVRELFVLPTALETQTSS